MDYVCGFLFNPERTRVVLIEKNRPEWQKGKLNGVGGKIELGESPVQAMQREFVEETGIEVKDWIEFAIESGDGWKVYFFYATSEQFMFTKTMTDEKVITVDIDDLPDLPVIPNLLQYIPVAADMNKTDTLEVSLQYLNWNFDELMGVSISYKSNAGAKGFTIGKRGKIMFWYLGITRYGNIRCYEKDITQQSQIGKIYRYKPEQKVTIHYKKQTND